jgi:hypothetical protein
VRRDKPGETGTTSEDDQMTPIKFASDADSFNRRVAETERTLAALVQERENLLITSRDHGVMTGHAKKMLAKVSFNIVMPEGYEPPASAPAEQASEAVIVRHGEQAAE